MPAVSDFMCAGFIACFQYALLANQSPIHGLYCAIIPNIVYAMLGTSRESAVGAMALVSRHTGQLVCGNMHGPLWWSRIMLVFLCASSPGQYHGG
jgi:MFS superfamily sulfate permease-like transporter